MEEREPADRIKSSEALCERREVPSKTTDKLLAAFQSVFDGGERISEI